MNEYNIKIINVEHDLFTVNKIKQNKIFLNNYHKHLQYIIYLKINVLSLFKIYQILNIKLCDFALNIL